MKGHLKKASMIIHKYAKTENIDLKNLKKNIESSEVEEFLYKSTPRKRKPVVIEEEKHESIASRTRRNLNKQSKGKKKPTDFNMEEEEEFSFDE